MDANHGRLLTPQPGARKDIPAAAVLAAAAGTQLRGFTASRRHRLTV